MNEMVVCHFVGDVVYVENEYLNCGDTFAHNSV